MSICCKIILLLSIVSLIQIPLHAQTRADCLACHSDKGLATERKGKEVSLFVDEVILNKSPHQKLTCVACHTGFNPENVPHKETIEPVNCLTCHASAPRKHSFHPQMVKANGTTGSPDVSCKQCHGTHDVVSPRVAGSKFHESNIVEACGTCHADVKRTFDVSAHAKALAQNVKGAPDCLTCHNNGMSKVRSEKDSAQQKIAQEKKCLSCHLDDPQVRARTSPSAGFIAAYEKSVHGAALIRGNGKVANCVNCHGSHEMKKGSDPSSKVSKARIPETCGACHADIAKDYAESVHGQASQRGVQDAPVCTDCHGEHNILSPSDPRSPVAPLNVSGQVCSPCHSSLALSQKYGIMADRYKTFSDSYHGLAIRAGSVEVANCASCHGVHTIKPSSDPASSVHKANRATTCGKCHAGANERFAIGSVHVVVAKQEEPILYWIATTYILLIVTTVGGMFIHNFLDFIKRSRRRLQIRRGEAAEEHVGHGLYLRMTLSERLQHGTLAVSFVVLVITGFMLRYPDAWWVISIRKLSDSVFDLRSLFHRIAAVVMLAASVFHIVYSAFTKRGRELVFDLLPRLQDARDAVGVMKYNLGFSKHKPKFGRFSYIEKSEYWALVWGTIVMALTGFIMWFDNTFIGLFTKLGYDIARAIHFYEAWLAMLAIIVWHFYYVIFNPDIYPINLTWLTGKITESEMAEEHPLELEAIKRKEMEEGFIKVPASFSEGDEVIDERKR
jgi:cytochrome b subunit of formate dehydrogenase